MAAPSFMRLALLALCLVLAAWWGTAYLVPPAPRPVDAPAGVFSAARALSHVALLSAAPRPVGSAGHAAAQDYLVAELRRLGLEPSIQDTVSAFRPVRISPSDMSDGLPGPIAARPANTMRTPGATRDGTVVRSLFTF